MSILKCKMCGGELHIEEGSTVCECEYCGSRQTIPVADDEKKMTLYERANRLRYACEFDKAASVYENIIADFHEEAESYWGLILCKYGIEYVDDPADGRKVPTCHRSSFDSVMDDSDFEMVMENSDSISRKVYREQAKEIEEIRKGIIEVSGKEEPYDIFICYKETDENGDRTVDSVIAQDVYEALNSKGYRVFFSRISLEDKLGTEYEPYIFAALNSAKIMLAFGSSYDYYNAVWVKNEWSRYLKLMAKDKEKHLIPCYKDIDAYDMPKEFKSLQAQDMGKVGAIQDLLRGIDKITGRNDMQMAGNSTQQTNAGQQIVQQIISGGPNSDALLKRGYDSLEDGEFDEAGNYFNDVLNSNAESAEAYLGLFMAEIHATNKEEAHNKFRFGDYYENRYWKRAMQYATGELATQLNAWKSEKDQVELTRKRIKEHEEQEIIELYKAVKSGTFELEPDEQAEWEKLNEAVKASEEAEMSAEKNLEISSENRDYIRLKDEIDAKKTEINSLGLFKAKEKKKLQAEIDELNKDFLPISREIENKKQKVNNLKNEVLINKRKAENYKLTSYIDKKNAAQNRIKEMIRRNERLQFVIAEVGSTITFGKYKQTKAMEWIVLDRNEKSMLLLSKFALMQQFYSNSSNGTTWENCAIRKLLNYTFLNETFSADENDIILTTNVINKDNWEYDVEGGNDTNDKVFLLSIDEAKKYFSSNEARQATTQDGNPADWWLRSPGHANIDVSSIFNDGTLDEFGYEASTCKLYVRPAMWIDISER